MADHRIRLSDQDIDVIVSALRARAAAVGTKRRHECDRLAERLAEGGRGNPAWRLSIDGQKHESLGER